MRGEGEDDVNERRTRSRNATTRTRAKKESGGNFFPKAEAKAERKEDSRTNNEIAVRVQSVCEREADGEQAGREQGNAAGYSQHSLTGNMHAQQEHPSSSCPLVHAKALQQTVCRLQLQAQNPKSAALTGIRQPPSSRRSHTNMYSSPE